MEAAPVKLSICIPTYNFGRFIGETLTSILRQQAPGLEVIVFDGGSTDDTEEIARPYATQYPAVRYVRQAFRGGIDRDMVRSIELARGEYCWLFSSDDIMKPGAVSRVFEEVKSGLDIYLCGLTLCDIEMNVMAEHRVSRAAWGEVFELKNELERKRYFELAETTTALFSFMGSLIIKRSRWLQHELEEAYVGSLWAHVVRILRMIPQGLMVKYLGESLLDKRGDNDSFMDEGLVRRIAKTIDGYQHIGSDVFGENSFEAFNLRRVVANEFPPLAFFFAKADAFRKKRADDVALVDQLVAKAYRDRTLRNVFRLAVYRLVRPAYRFAPFSYIAARNVYRALRKVLRKAS